MSLSARSITGPGAAELTKECVRSTEFACVRHHRQAAGAGDRRSLDKHLGPGGSLVIVDPEPDDTAADPTDSQPRDLLGGVSPEPAVGSHHEPESDAGGGSRGQAGIEDHVQPGRVRTEPPTEQTRPHRRLDPPNALVRGILDDLGDQPPDVRLGPQAAGRRGDGRHERVERSETGRQRRLDAVPGGQFGQGGRAHRAVHMQVEMGFRQGLEIVHSTESSNTSTQPVRQVHRGRGGPAYQDLGSRGA
ncbi:hypothetical protein EV644_10827 [Kribbella orskensis]|uniref:Uncharacterized protein n=1 Tax=Kribbella orskensis TaxID=2512216 RepID=A0ABY2BHV6_9ACTN|nr:MULTISPECIES: hypothetical protein [Kribbella]TCN38632.1 hypothetical protein EV642_10827 [Kribbella sp. VKM Ac-2500]TCO20813.1 hypothetical protein EV644_10827 [Kribbella orskensis]